jgi:predicted permease
MIRLRVFLQRLRGLFFKRRLERDLDEEIRSHLELQIEENVQQGMSPEAARQAALRKFGGVAQVKEVYRDRFSLPAVETAFQDLRYGLRMLRRLPGWTAVMGATLALGIGLTTAIFSLAYGILLRAMPYPDPDRLVALHNNSSNPAAAGIPRLGVCSADWLDWRAHSRLFEEIALTRMVTNFNLTGDGRPERVVGTRTTWNLPRALGLQPLLGRYFTEEEASRDASVVVLSYGFWERRFARDPAIVGRKIQMNGESFEVIGVMPPNFQYPANDYELWTPLFITPDEIRTRMVFFYRSVGRLKPGVSLQQAQAEMSAIMQALERKHPANSRRGVLVEPMLEYAVGEFRTSIYVLLAAVGCLLLIVCINLGGLLVARASTRTHEFAIRAALGASAGRLRRQTLAEALPLSVVGGSGGVLLAWWLIKMSASWLPAGLTTVVSIKLDWHVMAVAMALSVLVVLLASMLPARLASRVQLACTMGQGSRTTAGGITMRNALVAAQIAVTLVLVFAGGLLARSLVEVMKVNPGFSTQDVLTMQLTVPRAKYPSDLYPTDPLVADYYHRLVARVKTIPGVIEAGIVNALPLGPGRMSGGIEFEGKTDEEMIGVNINSATPGLFSALGIPLLRGRDFTEQDRGGAPAVGIIDEQLARRVFGNENPLGRRFRFSRGAPTTQWREIVGVVGHIKGDSLETDLRPQAYSPEAQQTLDRGAIVVRTAGRPESFTSAIVEQIHREDPDQPVYHVRSMEDWLDRSLQSRNLLTGLVTLFGGASLLLACLGLYGVVSYGAGLRLREFAIRTAVGAQPGDLRRLVLAHAARLWISGTAIGLVAAVPAGRALQSQLYGVGSADAVALLVAPCLLLVIALLAGLGPARRAGRVDPAVTLRAD